MGAPQALSRLDWEPQTCLEWCGAVINQADLPCAQIGVYQIPSIGYFDKVDPKNISEQKWIPKSGSQKY